MISVIIPTMNRVETLKMCLDSLSQQTFSQFDVVVQNDGGRDPQIDPNDYWYPLVYQYQENKGPATARNNGAKVAKSDKLIFIGDDCILDRGFVFRHWYSHSRDNQRKAVQGYTMFHPDCTTEFTTYLMESGIQSNYKALQDKGGSWKSRADGFCLTTNFSIDRQLFENAGGFNERFPHAAYEDVALGYSLSKIGVRTDFDPGAINWHLHRITFDSYIKRQQTEGKSRLILCLIHPEMSGNLIDPNSLRQARQLDLNEYILWAKELDHINGDDVKQQKYNRWGQVLQLASLKGLLDGLNSYPNRAMRGIEHMHTPESVHHILSGIGGIEREDYSYSAHCCEWLVQNSSSNWAAFASAGELSLYFDKNSSQEYFRQSMILGSGEKWPKERLEELSK